MSARELIQRLTNDVRVLKCKIKDSLESTTSVLSIDNLEVIGQNLVITFTTDIGSSSLTTSLPVGQELEIKNNVQTYNDLLTILTPVLYEFAYVREDQGTPWLPGGLGGTYYGSGLYMWDGTNWIEDDTNIFKFLSTITDHHSGWNYISLLEDIVIKENKEMTVTYLNIDGTLTIDGTVTIN